MIIDNKIRELLSIASTGDVFAFQKLINLIEQTYSKNKEEISRIWIENNASIDNLKILLSSTFEEFKKSKSSKEANKRETIKKLYQFVNIIDDIAFHTLFPSIPNETAHPRSTYLLEVMKHVDYIKDVMHIWLKRNCPEAF